MATHSLVVKNLVVFMRGAGSIPGSGTFTCQGLGQIFFFFNMEIGYSDKVNPNIVEVSIQETFAEQDSRRHKGGAVEEASMQPSILHFFNNTSEQLL